MNRLQVGGLALVINANVESNIGKVVKLVRFLGATDHFDDDWEVSIDNGVNVLGEMVNTGALPSKWLMPLGDKQTQDELAKEKELDNV